MLLFSLSPLINCLITRIVFVLSTRLGADLRSDEVICNDNKSGRQLSFVVVMVALCLLWSREHPGLYRALDLSGQVAGLVRDDDEIIGRKMFERLELVVGRRASLLGSREFHISLLRGQPGELCAIQRCLSCLSSLARAPSLEAGASARWPNDN